MQTEVVAIGAGQVARARVNYRLPGISRGPECQHAVPGPHILLLSMHTAVEVGNRHQVAQKVVKGMRVLGWADQL